MLRRATSTSSMPSTMKTNVMSQNDIELFNMLATS